MSLRHLARVVDSWHDPTVDQLAPPGRLIEEVLGPCPGDADRSLGLAVALRIRRLPQA